MPYKTQPLPVACARWVRIEVLLPRYGFTANAIQNYKSSGLWTTGIHYKKDPANRYIFNTEAIDKWLERSN